MALLALASWWLVRNAPQPQEPITPQQVLHEPDYYMRDFSIKRFDATGRQQSQISGTLMRHYPDTDTLEIDNVRIHAVNDQGHIITATAQQARSNAEGTEVQLFGNAVVVREAAPSAEADALPRLEFKGQQLHAWINEERVHSSKPVTLTRGSDVLSADSMDYNHPRQILRLQGRVRGTLAAMPKRAAAP